MDRHGPVAALVIGGATDRIVFTTCVREVLLPQLRPGDVVIPDNRSAHHGPAVAAFFPRQSMRYQSTVNAGQLVADAKAELYEGTPFQQEVFKAFVLAVMAGLRRNEIDKLEWTAFDFNSGVLRITATEHFQPKSEDSMGDVDLDEEIVALFRGFKAKSTNILLSIPLFLSRLGITMLLIGVMLFFLN